MLITMDIWSFSYCLLFYSVEPACADPGIFVRGVQVSLMTKALMFFCFFLVLSLFYRSQIVNFKEIYHFQGSRGGPTFSGGGGGGGVQLFPGGGSICLFPIEIHIICDFPGRVQTPCLPSGSALTLVKCSITLHFIGVFTVCKSTSLGISRIQRVKKF